jgi:hypothetical protein
MLIEIKKSDKVKTSGSLLVSVYLDTCCLMLLGLGKLRPVFTDRKGKGI